MRGSSGKMKRNLLDQRRRKPSSNALESIPHPTPQKKVLYLELYCVAIYPYSDAPIIESLETDPIYFPFVDGIHWGRRWCLDGKTPLSRKESDGRYQKSLWHQEHPESEKAPGDPSRG